MPTTAMWPVRCSKANMLNDKEPLVVLNTLLALSKLPQIQAADADSGSSDNYARSRK